jgi:hypothetical protein
MGLLLPASAKELKNSSWAVALFFLLPMGVLAAYLPSVFFSSEAKLWCLASALAASLPFTAFMAYRSRRLIALGIHPRFRRGSSMPMSKYFAVWIGGLLVLYSWSLVLFALVSIASQGGHQVRTYQVADLNECKGKCFCTYRVQLRDFPETGRLGLCISEELWSSLRPSEHVRVAGRYSPHVVYVESVQR